MTVSQRILLMAPQSEVRGELFSMLVDLGHMVVAEGSDYKAAPALIESHLPDAMLLAIEGSETCLKDILPCLKQSRKKPHIPVLAATNDKTPALKVLQLGANGCIPRQHAREELNLALKLIQEGMRYLSPRISEQLLDLTFAQTDNSPTKLTRRQRQILHGLAQGKTNKEIAFHLQISVKTVNAHRLQMMERLGIRSIAGLVMYALRQSIVDLQ